MFVLSILCINTYTQNVIEMSKYLKNKNHQNYENHMDNE